MIGLPHRTTTLWQGVSGTNNPCPSGYRLPTDAEWEAERASWGSNDAAGAFASPLKLPLGGRRGSSSGSLFDRGLLAATIGQVPCMVQLAVPVLQQ
jgi:hypothetical protein